MDIQNEVLAALLRIGDELAGIRTTLDKAIEPAPQEESTCAHPMEARSYLSGFGEPEEFLCKACGEHLKAEPEIIAHV